MRTLNKYAYGQLLFKVAVQPRVRLKNQFRSFGFLNEAFLHSIY